MGDEEHNMVQIVSNELGYTFQMPDGSQVLIRAESRPPESAKAEEPYSEAAVTDAQEAEDSQHTLLLDPGSEIVSEHDAALAAVGETHSLEQAGRRRVAVVLSDQGVATAVPLHCVVEAGLSQRVLFQEDGQPVILEVLDQTETGPAQESEDDPGEAESTPAATGQSWLSGTERARAAERASDGRQMKTGMWSREEVETLSANMEQFCQDRGISNPEDIIFRCSKDERKNFYRTVAKGINRPLFAIYRRIIRMYDRKNHMGRYTEEEVEQLRNLRAIHGNKWGTIGALMGRSAASVKDRVRVLRDNCNQGKWLKEEEERLERAVYEVTDTQPGQQVTSGINWAAVAQKVQTRREKQCRSKWLNNLSWKSAGGQEWTRDDDQHLIETLLVSGLAEESAVDWASLTERWPRSSVRSPQWLRGRWWTLKQQLKQHQNLGFRELLSALAQMKPRGDGLLEPGQDVDSVGLEEPSQEPQEQQEQSAEEQPQQQLQPMVTSPAPQAFLPPGARVFVDQDGHVLPPGSLAVPQEAAFVLEPPLPVAGYAGAAVVIGSHLYTALPPQPAAPLALVTPDRLVLEPAPAPAALLHHPGTQLPPHHESGVALVSAPSLPEPDYSVDLVDEPLQEVHLESSHAAVIRGDPIMSRTAPGATSEDESIDCPQ